MANLKKFIQSFCQSAEFWVLGSVTFILPFVYSSGPQGLRLTQMLGFVLIATFLWAIQLARHISLSAGFFFLLAAISALRSGFGNVHALALIFVFCGSFIVFYLRQAEISGTRIYLNFLIAVGLLQAFYGYLQMSGFDPVFQRVALPDSWIPVGTLGQQTVYGPFLVTSLCAALFLKPILAILIIPAIICTFSAMTYAACFTALLVYFAVRFGYRTSIRIIFASVILLLFLFLIGFEPDFFDPQGRLLVWRKTLKLSLNNPLFGWGLGSFKVIMPLKIPPTIAAAHGYFLQCHNEYLQTLFELGIAGLMAVIWMLYDFMKSAILLKGTAEGGALIAIFLSLAVNASGSFPMHIAPLALIALSAWSIVVTNGRRMS